MNGVVAKTDQVLTFRLGSEVYAIDVSNAREIVEYSSITQIPKTPVWIRGVVNLRGNVVPVLDLKLKFNMASTQRTVNTCVVVVEFVADGMVTVVGILADQALEVLELAPEQMAPPPRMGTSVSRAFIKAIAKCGDQVLIILDADRIFTTDEMLEAQQLAEEGCDETRLPSPAQQLVALQAQAG